MTKPTKASSKLAETKPLTIKAQDGEGQTAALARVLVDPYLRHGVIAGDLSTKAFGQLPGEPRFDDYSAVIEAKAKQALAGDMTLASDLLTAQALSLDGMMTELMRRSIMNFGDYPLAAERYARLAFKAQANSRATLEALAKLHQPREQTVRHVHVNDGGRAVVADNFHQHKGGKENEKTSEQPHATRTAGQGEALPSPDPHGNSVPIPGSKGQPAMQDARRQGKRRAKGQS